MKTAPQSSRASRSAIRFAAALVGLIAGGAVQAADAAATAPVTTADSLDSLLGGTAPEPAPAAAEPAPSAGPAEPVAANANPAVKPKAKADSAIPVAASAATNSGPTAPSKRAASNRLLEEIVVTAQKREENIQDVPISIQAFTQEKLDVLGITSVQDIQRATPGFTVTNAAGFNIVFLRGVGSDAFLPGVDSSVPFYIDGVPLLGIQGTSDTLGRIERVEVLKGPQGTLFGRNSTGGAISIVTPEPGHEFAADIKTEFGNYNTRNVTVYANVPINDRLGFNVSGFYNDQDNFIVNDTGAPVYPVYSRGGRIKLRWSILDQLSLTLNGTYQENSSNGSLDFQLLYPAPVLSAVVRPADPKLDRHLALDGPFGTQNNAFILGGTFNWNPEYFDAKLIYAKQRIKSPHVDADFDGTTTPIASAHGAGFGGSQQRVRQDTVELQFLSNQNTPFSEHLQLAAGLFYLSSLGGFHPIVFNLVPGLVGNYLPGTGALTGALDNVLGLIGLPPILGEQGIQLANYGLIKSRSYSVYTQGTYHVLENFDATLGARYQQEHRDLVDSRTEVSLASGGVTLPLPEGSAPELRPGQVSLRGALQWRPFGPETQIYTSWARGWKNPTYNTVNLVGNVFGGVTPLKAERVDTTELGIKSQLFDGHLQINAAAFYTDQKNPLSSNVTIISGGIANFTNAGGAVIKGVDGDILAVPLPEFDPGLVLTLAASYLDARYTSFTNGRGYDDATGLGFGDGGVSLAPRDLSGYRIPRVPEFSYTAGVSQRIELSDIDAVELGADTFFSTKIYFLPQESQKSRRAQLQLYNARASYFYKPWNVEATLFINNITNKVYAESAFVSDFGTAQIANSNPRLFGLRFKVTY